LVVILFVVSGYASGKSQIWKKAGKYFYKAVEAMCTLYTANEIITHAVYGTDASGSWLHESHIKHFREDLDFQTFTKIEESHVMRQQITHESETTHSPMRNIRNNNDLFFLNVDIKAANATWYYEKKLKYIEDGNGGWEQDLDYGAKVYSSPQTFKQYSKLLKRHYYVDMGEHNQPGSEGLYIRYASSYKYKVGKWPLISKVHSDHWSITDLHQPTLDIAQEKDFRYDAVFHYDYRKLTWVNQTPGYWKVQENIRHKKEVDGIKAWEEEPRYIEGTDLLEVRQIMTGWYPMRGRIIWKAHLESNEEKSVPVKRKSSLDTADSLAIETNKVMKVFEYDVDPESVETESLLRRWYW